MVLALGIGVSILSLPLLAHHGDAAYDMGKNITIKGTITQWIWANPHVILQLDVTDDRGQVVQWTAGRRQARTSVTLHSFGAGGVEPHETQQWS